MGKWENDGKRYTMQIKNYSRAGVAILMSEKTNKQTRF